MRLAACLALVVILAACDTTAYDPAKATLDVTALSQDPAALLGTWELATVTGSGQCGPECVVTLTAEEAGLAPLRFTFRADGTAARVDRGGRVELRYTVAPVPYDDGTESETAVLYLDSRPVPFGIDGDRLYTDDRPVDGSLREYVRR